MTTALPQLLEVRLPIIMGDDTTFRSLESRFLTAPEFFTQSQKHSLISCNITPTSATGKYSDVRMAKALAVIEPYLVEDEESDDVEYSYQVYAVKWERTASFFFRALYHLSEFSDALAHRPCTEEAVLLEAEVLRNSSSHVLFELFSKPNYSGRLVFEVWWLYSLCRINYLNYISKGLDTIGVNELTSHTSVRIFLALVHFYERCLADNWSPLYPGRRMTATERIEDLKKTHRLDVIGNIELARKVIDECGKPELLDSALVDLERRVSTGKGIDPQRVSNATPNATGRQEGNILRNILRASARRSTVSIQSSVSHAPVVSTHQGSAFHPRVHAQGSIPGPYARQTTVSSQSSVSLSTAPAISHQYVAPDEKPMPCLDSSSPDCIFSALKPTEAEGRRAGISSDESVCAVCQEPLFSPLGAPVVALIKSKQVSRDLLLIHLYLSSRISSW